VITPRFFDLQPPSYHKASPRSHDRNRATSTTNDDDDDDVHESDE
jgi:hypothetical protein